MPLYPGMTKRDLRWLICAALAGCAAAPDAAGEPDLIEKVDCGEALICGNSAMLGAHLWWELDSSELAYSPVGRVKIVDFKLANNVTLKPRVQGYRLSGEDASHTFYGGLALVGSHLWIDSDTGEHFLLKLESVGAAAYWEGGFDDTVIPTYVWSYVQLDPMMNQTTLPAPVCSGALIDLYYKDAILFTGDRYDGPTAKVKATGNTQPWFNFACRDDVLWKEVLFRYVTHAQAPPAVMHDVTARNVAIAAIHADYCGVNHPYTTLGTLVDWANRSGSLWIDPGYPNVEAIWGGNGRAICLTHPRKVAKSEVACKLDDCTDDDIAHWIDRGYEMITYVP